MNRSTIKKKAILGEKVIIEENKHTDFLEDVKESIPSTDFKVNKLIVIQVKKNKNYSIYEKVNFLEEKKKDVYKRLNKMLGGC